VQKGVGTPFPRVPTTLHLWLLRMLIIPAHGPLQGCNQLIFSGLGAKWCNVLVYLITKPVLKISMGEIARLSPHLGAGLVLCVNVITEKLMELVFCASWIKNHEKLN